LSALTGWKAGKTSSSWRISCGGATV
jgi:hypothetical protein